MKDLPKAVIKQMTALATSAFGLIAALAWNNVIYSSLSFFLRSSLPPAGIS